MKPKALLIATALLALLGGGVWWSNRDLHEKEIRPPAELSPKVQTLVQSNIAKIEVRRAAGESMVLEQTAPGEWKMKEPAFPTDREAMLMFLSTLTAVSSEKIVDEKPADLAGFGLVKPATQIISTMKDGKSHTVSLGEDAPVGGGSYAKADGDPRVFLINSTTRMGLDKFPADLRDKRLVTLDTNIVTKIEWTAKGATVELQKNKSNEWSIAKPKPWRADGWELSEVLRKLREAKLDPMLTSDQMADLAKQFATAPPMAQIALTDLTGATQSLEVRKNKEGKYYAKSSAVPGFHMLMDEMGKALDKSVEDLRNRKLFDFGFNNPGKVEYRDASRHLALTKAGDRWLAAMKPMDSVGVQSLIDRLRDLSAAKFVETGFTTGSIELSVASNEGKLTEKVSLAKAGDKYIARREGEAALYEVEGKTVDELIAAAGSIKEQQAAAPAKK